jgi:hypothetical protein
MQLAINTTTKRQLVPIIWKAEVRFDSFINGETTTKDPGTAGEQAIVAKLRRQPQSTQTITCPASSGRTPKEKRPK